MADTRIRSGIPGLDNLIEGGFRDKTCVVILVLTFRACTKAPRNGFPPGSRTVPEIVPPAASNAANANTTTRPKLLLNGFIV